jgi:hypothetical protein
MPNRVDASMDAVQRVSLRTFSGKLPRDPLVSQLAQGDNSTLKSCQLSDAASRIGLLLSAVPLS